MNKPNNDFEYEEPTQPGHVETMDEIIKTIATSERPTVRMRPLTVEETVDVERALEG